MDKKQNHLLALGMALAAALALSACSSSEVSEDGMELPADDLPVVDAETDMLPNSLEQPSDDLLADSAGDLQPEAVVDMPVEASPDQDPEANALADAVAVSEPTTDTAMTEPDFGPSTEAPPSLNEEAAPPVVASNDSFSDSNANDVGAMGFSSSGGGDHTYEIQTGDTLMKIAYKVYGDIYQWKRILEDNHDRISNPNSLVAGTQLKVDQPAQEEDFNGFERYLIKSGDTLGSISDDIYGTRTKWRRLWEQNDRLIKDPNRIYAGFFLKYTMSAQDRDEAERFRQMRSEPAPLANSMPETAREPSSMEASAPAQEPANQN